MAVDTIGQSGKPLRAAPAWHTAARQKIAYLLCQGMSLKAIGKEMKGEISLQTIYRIARSDIFADELRNMNETVYSRLLQDLQTKLETGFDRMHQLSEAALDTLEELMLDTAVGAKVRKECATDILDRNPDFSRTHKVESTQRTLNVDPRFLAMAAETVQQEQEFQPAKKETVQ
jgi:hypothetical protein